MTYFESSTTTVGGIESQADKFCLSKGLATRTRYCLLALGGRHWNRAASRGLGGYLEGKRGAGHSDGRGGRGGVGAGKEGGGGVWGGEGGGGGGVGGGGGGGGGCMGEFGSVGSMAMILAVELAPSLHGRGKWGPEGGEEGGRRRSRSSCIGQPDYQTA